MVISLDDDITQEKQLAQREATSTNMAGVTVPDTKPKLYIGRGKMLQSVTDDDKETKKMNSVLLDSMNVNQLMMSLEREVDSTANTPNILPNSKFSLIFETILAGQDKSLKS